MPRCAPPPLGSNAQNPPKTHQNNKSHFHTLALLSWLHMDHAYATYAMITRGTYNAIFRGQSTGSSSQIPHENEKSATKLKKVSWGLWWEWTSDGRRSRASRFSHPISIPRDVADHGNEICSSIPPKQGWGIPGTFPTANFSRGRIPSVLALTSVLLLIYFVCCYNPTTAGQRTLQAPRNHGRRCKTRLHSPCRRRSDSRPRGATLTLRTVRTPFPLFSLRLL